MIIYVSSVVTVHQGVGYPFSFAGFDVSFLPSRKDASSPATVFSFESFFKLTNMMHEVLGYGFPFDSSFSR